MLPFLGLLCISNEFRVDDAPGLLYGLTVSGVMRSSEVTLRVGTCWCGLCKLVSKDAASILEIGGNSTLGRRFSLILYPVVKLYSILNIILVHGSSYEVFQLSCHLLSSGVIFCLFPVISVQACSQSVSVDMPHSFSRSSRSVTRASP